MDVFLPTLSQMAFLFLFILIGYILSKFKVVPENSAGVLAKLENNVFIPALVMGTFINNFTVSSLGSTWKIFVGSFAILALVIPISIFASRLCTKDDYTRKIYTYGLSFSNFAFMGNAVVIAIFGDAVFFQYLIFCLPLWIMIYLWGVPYLLISDGKKKNFKQQLKNFINPMFIGMIIGMIIGLIEIPLPSFLTNVITTAGNCMSPVAMLLTGMTVASISLKKAFTNLSVYAVSFFRLLVFPLLFVGIFAVLKLPAEWDTLVICIICSVTMPLGLNTIVIPSAYGKDTTVASGMALISHLLSCITIPLIFMLLNLIIT